MKILVLTWEFPPRIVGGIARHVAELYPELHKLNHEIHILTVQSGDLLSYEVVEGIHIHRITVGESKSFFHWIGQMNERMGVYGGDLIQTQDAESPQFDLIHAHDWLVGDAAIALKYRFKIPLISTIHATEHGRNNGIYTDIQCHVHYQENRLAHESWHVIVCSQYMKREVNHSLYTPEDKIDVIYNGIRPEKKQISPSFDLERFRNRFAREDEKNCLLCWTDYLRKGDSQSAPSRSAGHLDDGREGKICDYWRRKHGEFAAAYVGFRDSTKLSVYRIYARFRPRSFSSDRKLCCFPQSL